MRHTLSMLAFIFLISCSSSKNTTVAQSTTKKAPIIEGITNPCDYIDTFKMNLPFVKTVSVGKMEDSISIKAVDGSFNY